MRPLLLKGHGRPLTRIRYNRDGDLLVTCAKDDTPNVWYTSNGERLGTYAGHQGTVWDCDISWDSTRLVTGSSDCHMKLWDMESGKELYTLQHKSGVRVVQFAEGEQMLMTVQDNTFSSQPTIFIYNLNADQSGLESKVPVRAMHRSDRVKINGALWGALNQTIIAAYDDGSIALWDVEKGVETVRVHEHKKGINDLQYNKDRTMIITASSDQTCHVYDATTLKLLKSFRSDRPLNAAAFSPLFNQIILGGGQEAMNVTNSSSKAGHFEVDFYHIIFEEYMSSVKGHFGPVNTLAMGVDGKSFASGAEDGYIRLHHFDKQYFASSTKYNW